MPDAVAPAVPHAATRLRPSSLGDYTITDGFWADQQEVNRTSVIPHCDASLEKVGWVENFRAAGRGTLAEERVGRLFTDSEIYKTMEAIAWENARRPSEDWDRRLAELTEVVRSAQSSDGYLNTFYGYEGGPDRYSDFEWGHELYCDGHLFQAAVAIARAGGPEEFLEVSRRLADHIAGEFADGNREMLCGHPEVETALVELYRTVGDERYLELARLFVERRGHRVLADTMFKGRDYYQDNVPVRDAEVLVGHSVRALYLAAGAIDVAVETGDDELLDAVRRQYDRTLERRTYLTGGMGSNHHGETYGDDWELPSERAYAETCAAIASVHVAWRLLLATGEERYADVIERTLYNSVISSPSMDGTEFFYVNALQRRAPGIEPEPGVPSLRRTDGRRASWFTTSCCPTNYARTLASLDAYLATTDDEGVQLHQYAAGDVRLEFGGRTVALRVDTDYPRSGTVTARVVESDGDPWTLGIRVPEWARSAVITTPDGEEEHAAGLASTRRAWRVGDILTLRLDVAPRWVYPDPRIDDIRGTVALARGPLVYALEAVDGIGSDGERLDLDSITVDTSVAPRDTDTDLGIPDIVAVEVSARVRRTLPAAPYLADPAGPPVDDARPLAALPYFRWANRGPSTMRVWLPRTDVAVVEAGR